MPVICTGGFQTASVITKALERGDCDAVKRRAAAHRQQQPRRDLRSGKDRPDKPCTYCNRCLVNVVENPLGCYEESRFPSREAMIAQIMSVFDPPAFVERYETCDGARFGLAEEVIAPDEEAVGAIHCVSEGGHGERYGSGTTTLQSGAGDRMRRRRIHRA